MKKTLAFIVKTPDDIFVPYSLSFSCQEDCIHNFFLAKTVNNVFNWNWYMERGYKVVKIEINEIF